MEMHQLRYFRAVADTLNFTRAAHLQHVSQPAMSQQIRKLEEELGGPLLIRADGATRLTRLGDVFLPQAISILEQVAQAMNSNGTADEDGKLSLTIGAIATVGPYFLPRALISMKQRHPAVHVKVFEGFHEELLKLLGYGEIDLLVTQLPVPGKKFQSEELARDSYYAVVPSDHRLSKRKNLTVQELSGEQFILLRDGYSFRRNVLELLRKSGIRPEIAFEAQDFCTIAAMVSSGIGVSVIPRMAAEERKGCAFIPLEDDLIARRIGALYLKQVALGTFQTWFLEELRATSPPSGIRPSGP